MNETVTVTANATATGKLPVIGYDILTPILDFIFGSDGLVGGISQGGIVGFFGTIWGIIIVLSFIISLVMLALYIYASIELDKLEEHQVAHLNAQAAAYAATTGGVNKSDRFVELQAHIDSTNPNDWKLSIIEADIILDDVLKRQGYPGASLGERLRNISPASLASLDDAWQAHKIRNQIAHAGADFVLTQKLARETINQYKRVFAELGIQ